MTFEKHGDAFETGARIGMTIASAYWTDMIAAAMRGEMPPSPEEGYAQMGKQIAEVAQMYRTGGLEAVLEFTKALSAQK